MNRIFSQRQRTDLDPSLYLESHFDYLDRTARPPFTAVRSQMEEWLAQTSHSHRRDLAARLQSRDDHHFEAAFFEMYLGALFAALGYQVQRHPRAGSRGRRPDFLVKHADFLPTLVEAATVDELTAPARAARNRLIAIYDMLNTLHTPDFFFRIDTDGEPSTPVPLRTLRRHVEHFVQSIEYVNVSQAATDHGLDGMPTMTFDHAGCHIEISVIPVSPARRGAINHRRVGLIGPVGGWIDDRTPIRDKIRLKANRYGHIRRPLVIAINAAGRHLDNIDIMEALFGRETFTFPGDQHGRSGEPVMTRQRDGAWVGPGGPHNRRVSAVLIVSSLLPWTLTADAHAPAIYLNPWARYPITSQLSRINAYLPKDGRMELRRGDAMHNLLRLPEHWPFHIVDSPGL